MTQPIKSQAAGDTQNLESLNIPSPPPLRRVDSSGSSLSPIIVEGIENISFTSPRAELSFAEIPLIDLEAIQKASGNERAFLVREFGDGLKDVGFVAIKAESLTPLLKQVNLEMRKYFALSLEEKMKDWDPGAQQGYSEQGRETAAGSTKADLKELFQIGRAHV